jgi:hypothetical protein
VIGLFKKVFQVLEWQSPLLGYGSTSTSLAGHDSVYLSLNLSTLRPKILLMAPSLARVFCGMPLFEM